MSKSTKRLRILNITVWITLLIWTSSWLLWFYPRKTAEVTDYKTTKMSYRVGDEIFVSFKTKTYYDGQTELDIRLFCDGGRYLLKNLTVASEKSDTTHEQTSVGIVPVIPTPDKCTVKTILVHEVHILPFVTRTYIDVWESNRFLVEAER